MLGFDFHGVRVTVDGDFAAVLRNLERDFSLFVTPAAPQAAGDPIRLAIWQAEPPWSRAPDRARCVMVKPNCVVYEAGGERWVNYQGRALCRFRYADESGDLWTTDEALAHEIAYLLLMSRVGELHDLRGVHRVHAVGLAVGDAGLLCFLPSGGGKTTLGLAALASGRAALLSDDTPLITRRGDILAFPIRIGCTTPPPGIDPRHLRTFTRTEHGAKFLIDADAFRDQIAWRATPRAVVIGERALGGRASLERMPRRRAAPELFRSVVVGVGLPQVVEYFLRFDVGDAARKSGIVASRTLACAALLARAQTYRFVLGRSVADNAALLDGLISSLS